MKYKKASAPATALALAIVVAVTTAFATSGEAPAPTVNPAWRDETEHFPEPVYVEPDPGLAELMSKDYESMTVRQFTDELERLGQRYDGVYPDCLRSAWNSYEDYSVSTFVSEGPYMHALAELGVYHEYFTWAKYPYNPPGFPAYVTIPAEVFSDTEPYVDVQFWMGFETLDPDAVTVGERERLLTEYQERLEQAIRRYSIDEWLTIDPIAFLHAERDRLTEELSTPALRLRAMNFYCNCRTESAHYGMPRTFIDNVETLPVQTPVSSEGAKLLHMDASIGIGYGELGGAGVISPDGGTTWYENGYRDPVTGVSHRYDPKTDMREVSIDNGQNWCREVTYYGVFFNDEQFYSVQFNGWSQYSDWYYNPDDQWHDSISISLAESLRQVEEDYGNN